MKIKKPFRLWATRTSRYRFDMDTQRKYGFAPVFDEDSKVLILGSFPSVKSRQIDFYYGNKQNRFWKTVCTFFNEAIPETTDGKKDFLKRRKIALWDMVISCEIDGSADATVRNADIADVKGLLAKTRIEEILLNGKLAYDLFIRYCVGVSVPYVKMPSTSPANPRFNIESWNNELKILLD